MIFGGFSPPFYKINMPLKDDKCLSAAIKDRDIDRTEAQLRVLWKNNKNKKIDYPYLVIMAKNGAFDELEKEIIDIYLDKCMEYAFESILLQFKWEEYYMNKSYLAYIEMSDDAKIMYKKTLLTELYRLGKI